MVCISACLGTVGAVRKCERVSSCFAFRPPAWHPALETFTRYPTASPRQFLHNSSQVTKRAVYCRVASPELGNQHQWWTVDSELWVDVHTEQELRDAVNDDKYDIVLVDWYATWCHACKNVYPKLCGLAADSELRKRVKFVKVNVDGRSALARREGAKTMPHVIIYRPNQGRLVGLSATPSKIKHLRSNLQVILDHPESHFVLDPNNFVVVSTEVPSAALEVERQAEIDLMKKQSASLFEHLKNAAANMSPKARVSVPTVPPEPTVVPQTTSHNRLKDYTSADHGSAIEKAMFLNKYKNMYGYDGAIDQLYAKEIATRMGAHEHYLDYTGSSLYCNSQVDAALTELKTHVFGNPHSSNPSSKLTSDRIEDVRNMVLKFFNADPSEYQVVFTRSATASLKMIGETFPWSKTSTFRYLRENHNSVLGVREYALAHGAKFQAVDDFWVDDWLAKEEAPVDKNGTPFSRSLFAYPAEDNFAGVKYPLDWIEKVQSKSTYNHQWMVMLDAAAFVPTQPLDLSKYHPDFVAVSFYKIFGYPTGLGALILKTENVDVLQKVFWGGGSVALATSNDNFHVLKCKPTEKLEDGTLAFLDIIALKHGFDVIDKLGGITKVQSHVQALTDHLYHRLSSLTHGNGLPMLKVFGKHDAANSREVQGGIVNFQVLKPDGNVFSYRTFELEAAQAGFHVRAGAECNPGACYKYLGVQESEVEQLAGVKEGCDDDVEFIDVQRQDEEAAKHLLASMPMTTVEPPMKWVKRALGSVRVSLGYMSRYEDVEAFVRFVERTYQNRWE